jgi:MFS family permease
LKLSTAGLMTMLPLAGVVAGSMGGGLIVDAILRRTGRRRLSRSGVGAVGMALAGLGSLAAIHASSPAAALAVLALGAGSLGLANPAAWAATMDLGGGRSAAALMAIANMAGNLAALLCPIAVGAMLDASGDRWGPVLGMLAAVAFGGALCWACLDPAGSESEAGTGES